MTSDVFRFLVGLAADLLHGRAALVAEKVLLRQQLIVAERKLVGRVRWAPWQRLALILVRQSEAARASGSGSELESRVRSLSS